MSAPEVRPPIAEIIWLRAALAAALRELAICGGCPIGRLPQHKCAGKGKID